MIHLIFMFLCGCLYLIGLLFGLNYEQSSVIICIYACPIICILCAFLAGIVYSNNWIGRIGKSLNYALMIAYIGITRMFWMHYDVNNKFKLCMNDLIEIGHKLNISYESLNLQIYCNIFFSIILFHLLQVILISYIKYLNKPSH